MADGSEARIVSTPGICGGKAHIAGTRIPVWQLEVARRVVDSDVQILFMFPALKRYDLAAAWEYVSAHEAEIQQQIEEND